ncbi:MAG TPA: phosphoribosylglycinamide formyltransferase [Steroidobacteraceae bacterium]|nr:phosphoribosylglycinamide formyltransferase [Steroidobacteraceae bacterium]
MTDPPRTPIVVLISGRGSNMRALVESSREPPPVYEVAAVLADRADAPGLEAARALGVPASAVAARGQDRSAHEAALAAAIDAYHPALIALAGFMRILSPDFVARYRGRILNIHPALLPRHRGLDTHRRVLEAHETEHGATVHFVTEALDAGPAVLQARIAVRPDDDAERLSARVLAQEHLIYPLAVRWFCEGRLTCRDGRAWLDGRPLAEPLKLESALGKSA